MRDFTAPWMSGHALYRRTRTILEDSYARTDETKIMFGFTSGFMRGFVTVFGLFVLLLVALAVLGALAS